MFQVVGGAAEDDQLQLGKHDHEIACACERTEYHHLGLAAVQAVESMCVPWERVGRARELCQSADIFDGDDLLPSWLPFPAIHDQLPDLEPVPRGGKAERHDEGSGRVWRAREGLC